MADKDSTSSIVGKITNEDELPDHHLSPNSTIRKKRATEQFYNEVRYAAWIQHIRLESAMKFILEEKQKQFEREMEFLSHKEPKIIIPADLPPSGLISKTKDKPEMVNQFKLIQERLYELIRYLDNEIKTLDKRIAAQRTETASLRQVATKARQDLAQAWSKHFEAKEADPDFEGLRFASPEPGQPYRVEEVSSEAKEEDADNYFQLDKAEIMNAAKKVREELHQGKVESNRAVDNFVELLKLMAAKKVEKAKKTEQSSHPSMNEIYEQLMLYARKDFAKNSNFVGSHLRAAQAEKNVSVSEKKEKILIKTKEEMEEIKSNAEKVYTSSVQNSENLGAYQSIIDSGKILLANPDKVKAKMDECLNQVDSVTEEEGKLLAELCALDVATNKPDFSQPVLQVDMQAQLSDVKAKTDEFIQENLTNIEKVAEKGQGAVQTAEPVNTNTVPSESPATPTLK